VVRNIPLQGVKPGRYQLRLEARVLGNANKVPPAARETAIVVASSAGFPPPR
jgi:hypothetical protein